jgi:hypothetical protein
METIESLNGRHAVSDGALVTMASLFIHTIIVSQKRNTLHFIQVYIIIWWDVESIGVVNEEHHRQDGRVVHSTRLWKKIVAT